MSWLARVFKPKQLTSQQSFAASALMLEGEELVEVVGESHYQPALRSACGVPDLNEPVRFDCIAALVLEPDNPYDSNAIKVQVDGRLCGYLSREDALRYRDMMIAAAERRCVVACRAMIAGRGAEGTTSNLGVFLHLPEPAEAGRIARN